MNKNFYSNLDVNFEQALELSEKNIDHDELILMLKEGNIPQKQIAALKLDSITNQLEADILLSNLTGCDGKIREAVALKINNLLNTNNYSKFFLNPDLFADATIDINANICRLVIDSVSILKNDKNFSERYLNKILDFIAEAFEEIDKFIFKDKKYVINKQLFKLYWSLEALKLFVNNISSEKLQPILERALKESEYTIREKVAQIVSLLDSSEYDEMKLKLAQDENYYVRKAILND